MLQNFFPLASTMPVQWTKTVWPLRGFGPVPSFDVTLLQRKIELGRKEGRRLGFGPRGRGKRTLE